MKTVSIPLFPLHTVLFPGGPLPLRIFEARYVDMVSNCMKTGTGFGVSMISHGREVGEAAATCTVGTLANIVDWHMRHDGLLGITSIGGKRFRIASVKVLANQLSMAKIEWLPDEPEIGIPDEFLQLVDLLRRLIDQAGHHYAQLVPRYGDASWVSFRLAELLPISMYRKQQFLEMTDPVLRLEQLVEMLEGLEIY
jgi:uncharacterized protein